MKIIFIITGLGIGGAERQVYSLANDLQQKNEITIISLTKTKNKINLYNSSVKIIQLNISKNPILLLYFLFKTKKITQKIKPDICHSHMFHANIFSRLLRLLVKIPVLICTAHSKNEGGKLRMFIYRITDWLATISTNVSQEAVDAFIEKKATKPGRMLPFYNGIDTGLFSYSETARKIKREEINISNDTPLILAVGRLTEAKDYPNLLRAFSKLNISVQPKLVIIGDGEEKENLQRLSKELNVSDNVIWLGMRHDVQDWMSACDLFVLSSAWEGFGLVVAEAMACERIVIGTDSGGVKEVIGDAGFVIPTKDGQCLTDHIDKALNLSLSSRQELGNKARQHIINNFSLDTISQQWLELYKKLSK